MISTKHPESADVQKERKFLAAVPLVMIYTQNTRQLTTENSLLVG